MNLKFSAILLSSVLVSASFGAEIKEVVGIETAQLAVSAKVVPDSFEGVGEYRARRAALESKLQSFQGQKLKVFTPEIFAEMLGEGIQIAELGVGILSRLPVFVSQLNIGLLQLKERIDGTNALISWEALGKLAVDISRVDRNFKDEFLFDFKRYVNDLSLTEPVRAAHKYTMDRCEDLSEVGQKVYRARHSSVKEFSDYSSEAYSVENSLSQLVKLKFIEDDEDLARFVSFVVDDLKKKNLGWNRKELDETVLTLKSDFSQWVITMLQARLKQEKQAIKSEVAFYKTIVSEILGLPSEDLKSEWYYVYTSTILKGNSRQEPEIKVSPESSCALQRRASDLVNEAFDRLPEFVISGLPRVKNDKQ